MKKTITLLFVLFTFLLSAIVDAQDILKSNNLSSLKVDNLKDSDITNIQTQLKNKYITLDQAEAIAIAKGMTPAEFTKLRNRISAQALPASNETIIEGVDSVRNQEVVVNSKVKDSLNSLIFGSELFDNPTLNFEPNLKLATPVNYVLGPGDELQVSVYGVQEYNASLIISAEGQVAIQNVGQLAVSGMTIEAATQKIKNAIAAVYSTVRTGKSQVGVSLSRIRTIKVTIVGGKQPGNYSVSSLATVYNALFLAGGPGKNGSYRNIELIRNNKVYKNIDIYHFLVNGDQSENVGLKDNDVIRIPVYTHRVTLEGEVKRPGIFEMKKGETFTDLLSFASGFNEFAYTASVNVMEKTSKQFKIKDIKKSDYNIYEPLAGDVIIVSKILNRFENRIQINGAVFRPGIYSLNEGMRISDLVAQADGLKEDAYTKRAIVLRLKPNLTTEIVNVNLTKALEGVLEENIILKKEDIFTVYSVRDFVEDYKVTIDGEIKRPGEYDYYEGLSLNDLLLQVGGLTGSASKRVEIARMIKSDEINEMDSNRVELFNLEITPDNNEQLKNFVLQPFDVINIRKMAMYQKPEWVTVNGAVHYSGKYVLATKQERLYDVIQRAGGLTSLANLNGVKIKRPFKDKQIEDLQNVDINLVKSDTVQKKIEKNIKENLKFLTIPVDWTKIVNNPKDKSNVVLFPGDEIVVSDNTGNVSVVGNVLLTSEIPYAKGKSFDYYINAVGGVDAKAWKRKSYIVYPNGKAAVPTNFLFLRSYPKVVPGSQIVVPQKPERRRATLGEVGSIASIMTSIAFMVYSIFR